MKIKDAIETDRSNLTPIETPDFVEKQPLAVPDARLGSLLKNPYARCPLPPTNNSADSLRQWGQGSDVPKFRTNAPPNNIGGSSGTTVVHAAIASTSGGGSGGGSTPTPLPTAQSVNTTTPALAPGQTWTGTLQMAKGFLVQQVSTNAFARVELYGTKTDQTLDLSRPITTPPPNTTSGIIMDVALQSVLIWQVLDCVGSNGDSTVSSTIYVTVTNLTTGVRAISVTLRFVPSQS